jgi:hypothetical protein
MNMCPVLNSAPRHEDPRRNRGIAPCILNLGTRRKCVANITPRPLYSPGKCPRYPNWIAGCMGHRDALNAVAKRKKISPPPRRPRAHFYSQQEVPGGTPALPKSLNLYTDGSGYYKLLINVCCLAIMRLFNKTNIYSWNLLMSSIVKLFSMYFFANVIITSYYIILDLHLGGWARG